MGKWMTTLWHRTFICSMLVGLALLWAHSTSEPLTQVITQGKSYSCDLANRSGLSLGYDLGLRVIGCSECLWNSAVGVEPGNGNNDVWSFRALGSITPLLRVGFFCLWIQQTFQNLGRLLMMCRSGMLPRSPQKAMSQRICKGAPLLIWHVLCCRGSTSLLSSYIVVPVISRT